MIHVTSCYTILVSFSYIVFKTDATMRQVHYMALLTIYCTTLKNRPAVARYYNLQNSELIN